MTPAQIKLALQFGAAAVMLALAFAAGWAINGWRLHSEVADLKTTAATVRAVGAEQAVTDLTAAAEVVKEAAIGNRTDNAAMAAKLDTIERRIKNAPPPPLPVGCKPGPDRLRNLSEAAAAIDAAIARSVPGR